MTSKDALWLKRIHEPFITAALGIALTAGFGYAVILVEALGHKVTLGTWWAPLVQAHGHAQMFGWLGLFVMGMGLYFLPRLGGVQLKANQRAPYALGLLVAGIALRSVSQPLLGFVETDSDIANTVRIVWLASAFLEIAGIVIIASMIVETRRALSPLTQDSPAWSVLPFIATALTSFVLALLSNASATISATLDQNATLNGSWDAAIIQLMLYGVAIPIAFAFSIRNLPLFMRLAAPPRARLRWMATFYAIGLLLRLTPSPFAMLGWIIQGAVILLFVWELDLIHRKPAWITERIQVSRPDLEYLRKPTRPGFPDAGEYGRFELLIYSAYFWLVVVAIMGIVRGASTLIGVDPVFTTDMERHALTMGFITLLIFGMAPRMTPGFSAKRKVVHPRLVTATFVLGNLAVLSRVLPLLAPAWEYSSLLLAPSGGLGWVAVLLLAINLTETFRSATT